MQTSMTSSKRMLALAFIVSTLIITSPVMAQETITPIMSHALAEVSGEEVLMYTVDFPPGFRAPFIATTRRSLSTCWKDPL